VKRVVYGGLGLAHFEGQTLFLPYTAPGDTVDFVVEKEKKGCLFGRVESVAEPSPSRVKPECPVFGECGGCQLLHVGYEEEVRIKKETAVATLRRIGGVRMEPDGVTVSPSRFGYRNHALFKVGEGGARGFSERESSRIVPFPEQGCLLLPLVMREAIAALPAGSLVPGTKVRSRIDSFGNVHFWGVEGIISPPDVLMEAGGLQFPVAPEAFFQINDLLNGSLMELVTGLPSRAPRSAVDLYCGAGFFTLPLARGAEKVTGIEVQRQAVKSAAAAAKLNRIENVRFVREDAERALSRIGEADLVLTDPPRTGMSRKAIGSIARLRPAEVIMVSCDPPTFARDASRLAAKGYHLASLHLVDMFPGTYHVETVGLFRRS